jgi:GntR family transcriptional regulator
MTENVSINRQIPLPYYYQLEEILREQMESGKWWVDQRIPSEAELCEAFRVSRTVVRQALNDLVSKGMLYRQKGKGTFVAKPKIDENLIQNLTGFYDDMVARGLHPVTQVLTQKTSPANKKVAHKLTISEGALVIEVERLRFINDQPIVLVTTYLPYELCPELLREDLTSQSLYHVLEDKFRLRIARGRRTIEAVAANEREARLLQVKRNAPLVLLDSVSYLEDGRPIEYFHALHRGDRARFEVELVHMRRGDKLAVDESRPLPNSWDLRE